MHSYLKNIYFKQIHSAQFQDNFHFLTLSLHELKGCKFCHLVKIKLTSIYRTTVIYFTAVQKKIVEMRRFDFYAFSFYDVVVRKN